MKHYNVCNLAIVYIFKVQQQDTQLLINAMIEHKDRLQNVKIMQLHTKGAAPNAAEGMEQHYNWELALFQMQFCLFYVIIKI